MTSQVADLRANLIATPPVRSKVNRLHGRIRIFEATVTIPAVGMPLIGETITWGDLPKGCRPLGHLGKLYFAAGAVSQTLTLGDGVNTSRHLAATSVTAAGSAIPEAAAANGAQFEVTDDSVLATNNSTLVSVVGGATLTAGAVYTLKMPYVWD